MKSRLPLTSFCIIFLCACSLGQTYEIQGQGKAAPAQNNSTAGSDLGWGSSIDVARQARAAQDALKRNDYSAAASYAENAAKSAPRDPELWFLLGYADRLADHLQASVSAYNRGLALQPNSVKGMAGLAQTYVRMGRDAEAQQLLQRVVDANPKDATSLQLAGELLLNSDPAKSVELLQRADVLQPSAHTDLLIAHAYQRLGKADESQRYLNRAKARAPRDPDVLRAVAGEYREQGQYDLAISALQSLPSKNLDAQAELAYTYQLAGKQQEAATWYSRLAKSAKGNLNLDLSAAQSWISLGQPDAAQPFLDDARRLDAKNYRLHALLGGLAESEDRDADAGNEYNLALSNLPPNIPEGPLYPIELRLNLYELDLRNNDQAAAQQQLTTALAEINQAAIPTSSRPEMLRLRAAIEAGSGNLDAANQDLKEALALEPANLNSLLNYANLQWKLGQKDAARESFERVLEKDPHNRAALSSLGFLARDKGDNQQAEEYFTRAATAHPRDFVPYLALGDLYTAERNFHAALTAYENAHQRMPGNALAVAGGANAALESHNPELAKRWLDRAKGAMNDNPQVGRERERYLTLQGEYAASAKIGETVLGELPHDREVIVYLAYDLYYLNRYPEALDMVAKYDPVLRDDKDLPLIAGYIHAHAGDSKQALTDFNLALDRDPQMATGYVNRGFVFNTLHAPGKAAKDFQLALQLQPDYGEAHLGLAFAELQLHRPKPALLQLTAAQKMLGKSHAWHLARAEAFRQEQDFNRAEAEYRVALQETPNDFSIQMEYAETLYRMRRYQPALATLDTAQKLAPSDSAVYALRAQVHARMNLRSETSQDIQLAERYGPNNVDILMSTGDALLTLGDRDAAMQRFSRALDIPNGDRIGVRLAVAQVFLRQGRYDDVRRQLALGFAEARMESSPVTPDDILEAANIFLAMHDFQLAETYFDKARLAGASPRNVAIGQANAFLAAGHSRKAEDALASLGPAADFSDDYDYLMAKANLYRQRQDTAHALSAFAQASSVAGHEDQGAAETARNEIATQEGWQLTRNFSVSPGVSFAPALEDINVYTLDAKILGVTNPSLLPPPRHSFQDVAESNYRVHIDGIPTISGFVGSSITTGRFLFPSDNVVQDRNTYDTFFNGGITPVLHLGPNSVAFNGGLQYTIRRDTISPVSMSQNLFRQYLYMSTSSFFDWVSVNGSAIREAGPFTNQNLHSRDASANLEFTVGRPWGRTALITGYSVRDLLFRPVIQEYFNTATYVGVQHKFGSRFTAAVLAEDLRAWRVQGVSYALAQALVPGARFDFQVNPRWNVQGSFLLSRGEGYHQYDNAQGQFLVSYMRSFRGGPREAAAAATTDHPLRFSFGVQQQTFYNFGGSAQKTAVLPIVQLSLF